MVQRDRAESPASVTEGVPNEQTRLLPPKPSTFGQDSLAQHHGKEFGKECWLLLKWALPVVLSLALQYSINVASVFSLGHLVSDTALQHMDLDSKPNIYIC